MDKKIILLLQQTELKKPLYELLFSKGYLIDPVNPQSLSEKALKVINKKTTLSEDLYNKIVSIFKNSKGTINTKDTADIHFNRMIKLNKGIVPDDYGIIEAAKLWTSKSSFPGEIKYFFFKENSSRCLDQLNTLSLNKPRKEIAERV